MKYTSTATVRVAQTASALALTLALTACGGSSAGAPQDATPPPTGGSGGSGAPAGADPAVVALLPAAVKEKGALVVGTEAQYPPFEFYESDNTTIIGFDADIAAELARLMGLTLTLKDASFDSIIPSLAGGRYDLGMSGFTVTAERQQQVDFVTYYYEGDGLMVKAGNPGGLSIGDSLCGVKVALLKGSTQHLKTIPTLDNACAQAGKPAVAASVVPGSNDLALSLQSGRVAAVLTDGSNAAYTVKLSNGTFEVAPGKPFNPAPFGVASPKGNGMDKAIHQALETMLSNGSYAKILAKWGMQAGAIETPKINEAAN